MFQEFQVSVTPLDRDRYLVRTENVAPGVPLAEEQVSWSVEEWLEEARQLMSVPLLQVFQGEDVPPSPIALGQKLYDALFQGSLRDSWITAQGIAHYQRSLLRLRLGLKGNLLPRLPWEVLHSGGSESSSSCYRPLATGTDIAFSRHHTNGLAVGPTVTFTSVRDRPLRILMAIAGPSDRESLDVQQEARDLQAELTQNGDSSHPAIELILLPNPGREELTQALEQGQYDVFHYAGHSNLGDSGGDIYLVNRTTGLTETLSGEDLAGLLANNGVQLAVFNSCRGADTALDVGNAAEGERNLAQALVKCGIPAVLAMAERIPDEVAKTLTRLFYRNLNQGYPIDLSLSRARQGLIAAYGSDQLYWALPVLYLHPKFNGMLMEVAEEEALTEELLGLSEADEIPLELLGGEEGLSLMDEGEKRDDDPEFLAPFESLTESNGIKSDRAESETMEDEAFIRGLISDLAPSETAAPSPLLPPPTPAIETVRSAPPPQQSRRRFWLWALLAAIALGAIAFSGWWFLFGRESSEEQVVDSTQGRTSVQPNSTNGANVNRVSTEALTAKAIEQAIQGQIEESAIAIEELLDPQRNALPYARAALDGIPLEQQDEPQILFLRGRLAWQSVLQGNTDFSVDDARRYWESAVKADPNSLLYQNALGFAYYEEGDFARANLAWSDALELGQQQTTNPDERVLTTYAGLALALRQMAASQRDRTQQMPIDKAIKLRQLVMTQDPAGFQSDALSAHWLWSEKAIDDWQALGAASDSQETE